MEEAHRLDTRGFPATLEYFIKLPHVNKTYTHDGGKLSSQPGLDGIITPLGPVCVQFDLSGTSCGSGKNLTLYFK